MYVYTYIYTRLIKNKNLNGEWGSKRSTSTVLQKVRKQEIKYWPE